MQLCVAQTSTSNFVKPESFLVEHALAAERGLARFAARDPLPLQTVRTTLLDQT